MSAKLSSKNRDKRNGVPPALGRRAEKPTAADAVPWTAWCLRIGVASGALLVPSVFWFGLRNAFGPPKALVLAVAATFVLVGLAMKPGALPEAADRVRRSPLAWAIGALCVLGTVSTLTAIDVRQAILGSHPDYRGLLMVLACAIVGVGSVALWSHESEARWMGRCFAVAAMWVGGIGLLQRAQVFPTGSSGSFGKTWRVGATLGNSSNLGVYLAVLIPLVLWVALSDRNRTWRAVAWTAIGLDSLALVWTLSRGAWLGVIVAFVLTAAMLQWSGRGGRLLQRRPAWALALIVAALVVGVVLTPTFASRASTLLDTSSKTAQWRLSTWRSSVSMTLARPFLGFGPNQFRFAYPLFQEPGQIDGRKGYQMVESAHNLEADTATSFGLAGLAALLAAGALAGIAVWRTLAHGDNGGKLQPAALGLALTGGVVALQFHYVTMDTGPLLALTLGGLVCVDAGLRPAGTAVGPAVDSRWLGLSRAVILLLALAYAGVVVAAAGLLGAERAVADAMRLAKPGAEWAPVDPELSRAEALAPWEVKVVRARGTTAAMVSGKNLRPAVAFDGVRAFDRAVAMSPADAVLAAERANLLFATGVASKDRAALERAAAAFSEVERMDPNTGIASAGRGGALLALGRIDDAIAALERAVELSPRYRAAWRNLALAYRAAGRTEDATRAGKRRR